MVTKNPNNEKKSTKWSNPLDKVISGVKKFMKKEKDEEKKPSSFSTSIRGTTPEAKKAKRSERKRKDTDKEKKLPKKYKKGW